MVSFGNTTFLIKGEGATYDITCSVITNSNMTSFKRFESKPVVKIIYTYTRGGSRISSQGAHLKKWRRAEGGTNIFGVFRVKNHDFTPKNQIYSNCGGRCENCWVFRVKNHDFTQKKITFFPILGGVDPPLYTHCNL